MSQYVKEKSKAEKHINTQTKKSKPILEAQFDTNCQRFIPKVNFSVSIFMTKRQIESYIKQASTHTGSVYPLILAPTCITQGI